MSRIKWPRTKYSVMQILYALPFALLLLSCDDRDGLYIDVKARNETGDTICIAFREDAEIEAFDNGSSAMFSWQLSELVPGQQSFVTAISSDAGRLKLYAAKKEKLKGHTRNDSIRATFFCHSQVFSRRELEALDFLIVITDIKEKAK